MVLTTKIASYLKTVAFKTAFMPPSSSSRQIPKPSFQPPPSIRKPGDNIEMYTNTDNQRRELKNAHAIKRLSNDDQPLEDKYESGTGQNPKLNKALDQLDKNRKILEIENQKKMRK